MVDGVGLPLNAADLLPTLVKLTKKVTEQVRLLAGHYIPQLASLILSENKKTNGTNINLHGIAIGNAVIDDNATDEGIYDFYWTHALNYDETNAGINEYCGYGSGNFSAECFHYQSQSGSEYGVIDIYNIYAPLCDGCIQKHAARSMCKKLLMSEIPHGDFADNPTTILPTITQLIENGISVWIYSGDTDGCRLLGDHGTIKKRLEDIRGKVILGGHNQHLMHCQKVLKREIDVQQLRCARREKYKRQWLEELAKISEKVSKQMLELYEQNKVAPTQTRNYLNSGEYKGCNFSFEYRLRVSLGPVGDLLLTSRVRNTNTDQKPFSFTVAYKTYFSFSDISEICVEGLKTLKLSTR
ncbi:unnamed protein product [Lactuca saligna]|uniref:Uncharacterized protein n=1 Tax=Lactuca saligna TaxID=75948 RepID=A0AA35ZKT9_LACSI|nr:unnamed protein product [Lactuca saligna]